MDDFKKLKRYLANELFGENVHLTAEKRELMGYASPIHWHNYFELEIMLEGEADYMLNGRVYKATKGTVFLMTPIDFHSFTAKEKFKIINISFDEEMLTERMLSTLTKKKLKHYLKLNLEELDRFIKASELLIHEYETNSFCQAQLCEYIILSLLTSDEMINQKTEHSIQESGIRKAILYLDLHFRENITLGKLADISGFNPTYFSELFKQITGENFSERLSTLRINYAKTLLKNGFTVTDACYSSGFGSVSNFLTAFKRKCGVTPSYYKQNQ